jgi:hypothetical protein
MFSSLVGDGMLFMLVLAVEEALDIELGRYIEWLF